MKELELYKELYYHELTTKESIDSRFNNPFSVYVILIGGMGYLVGQAKSLPNETRSGIIIMMLIIYGLSLGYTGYYLYRSYHRFEYGFMANPLVLIGYKKEIECYYDKNYDEFFSEQLESKEELVEKDFNDYLLKEFASVATHNQELNHQKYTLFFKVGNCLVLNAILWVVIFLLITLL